MSTDQVTNFEVKILLLKDSYRDLLENGNVKPFLPGMSASADIMTERKTGVLSLPIQAVTTRLDTLDAADSVANKGPNDTPREVIFLYVNGKAVQKEIKSGIQDNNFIEITEGLKDSVEVIIAPYDIIAKKLKDGTHVNKVKEADLYKKKKKK
jgi:HlyD family secretion protein